MTLSRQLTGALVATAFVAGSSASAYLMDVPASSPPSAQADPGPTGVREADWAPDGRRIAVSRFDEIWTMSPDGRDARRLVPAPANWIGQRDPAWSPDGSQIAFAADRDGSFDIWVAPSRGGAARQVTSLAGDERWPSWTSDGRIVFSHRTVGGPWSLNAIATSADGTVDRLSPAGYIEWQGRVSPDGGRIVFLSTREPLDPEGVDVWVRDVPAGGSADVPEAARVTRGDGIESHPVWAPDGGRVAYAAERSGRAGVWVTDVMVSDAPGGRGGRGRGGRGAPAADTVLASRRSGVPAWSPDGDQLLIATVALDTAGYNGDPVRNDADAPAMFSPTDEQTLWILPAPRAVDAGARMLDLPEPEASRWVQAFDQVWQTLASMYYRTGSSAQAWEALRAELRPAMTRARGPEAAEAIIDDLVGRQPPIKSGVESTRGVVSSGNPLASAAGALMLEKGGNVVDAGIAVSFALGVVEPDASGLGGDGQAILFLRGMREPVVIEYKDMTPGHATRDNPRLFDADGNRTARDGPSVANIPGTVAGLDLLYRKYGSGNVTWADVIDPAIRLAEDGFVLDEALPTTVARGRASLERYASSAALFMPDGRLPQPGDRFVNRDYGATLRTLAAEGAEAFYRGSIAERIAADMEANGGIITLEDLAQYRAIERTPLMAEYRGHRVYAPGPPVSTGLQLLESLQVLDQFQPAAGATYVMDADYLHHVIDAWRVRDGGARIADPERWPVDLGNHLERAHAVERFGLISPTRAYVNAGGGRGRGTSPVPVSLDPIDALDQDVQGRRIQTGTTAFVVADADGNMIAFTQTLSTWGGTFYVSDGLGFLYNDHFRGFRGGLGYGSTLPLMRSSTTSVPTLVFAPRGNDAGREAMPGFASRLAVGAAGNAWIPASVYDIVLNVVDGGMTAQQAIEAPRFLIGNGPGGVSRVQIEDRLPGRLLADLERRGHTFATVGRKGEVKYGYASVAVVDAARGTVTAGAEPRRSHGTAAPGAGR